MLTSQFEQVEGIQEDLPIMDTGMQLVEVGPAILPAAGDFPVHDDGAGPKGQGALWARWTANPTASRLGRQRGLPIWQNSNLVSPSFQKHSPPRVAHHPKEEVLLHCRD